MYNSDYLENNNNLVEMAYALKGQLHDQYIVDTSTEVKCPEGSYEILDPDKK